MARFSLPVVVAPGVNPMREIRRLDVSGRNSAAKQLTAERAAVLTPVKVLGGSDGWKPGASEP